MLASVVLCLQAALAGCGVKGPPELPEGVEDDYPRSYPAPEQPLPLPRAPDLPDTPQAPPPVS